MGRKKQAALAVPLSETEAVALLALYVGDDRCALKVRLHYQASIDKLEQERDSVLAAITEIQKPRFAALKAWWEAGGKALAGKKRSAELAGALLGIRLTPLKVMLPKGLKDTGVVEWLRSLRWAKARRFLRTKVEFDKEALIKAHGAEEDVRRMFSSKGIGLVQTDEFFIDTQLDEAAIRAGLTRSTKE